MERDAAFPVKQVGSAATPAPAQQSDGPHPSIEEELDAQFTSESAPSGVKASVPDFAASIAKAAPKFDFKVPTLTAPKVTALPAANGLPLSRQVELIVGKHLTSMREDTAYYGKMWMKRARRSLRASTKEQQPRTPLSNDDPSARPRSVAGSIFAKMSPLQPATPGNPTVKASAGDGTTRVHVETLPGTPKATRSTQLFLPAAVETLKNVDVPGYAHYVSLGSNMLAPNTMTMNVWPFFGDDEPQGNAFDDSYYVDVSQRSRKLKRLLQAQKAEEYAEMTMKDLNIDWNDILRILLDPTPDVGGTHGARDIISKKDAFTREDVPQSSQKWTVLLSKLPASDPTSLSKAAFLCDSFQRIAGFPIWHVARRSDVVKQGLTGPETQTKSPDDCTCRVCFRYNCHQHGELRENEDSDSDIGYESDTAVATDLIYPLNVNYRKRVPFIMPDKKDQAAEAHEVPLKIKKNPRYWDLGAYQMPPARGPFYPCDHPGLRCDDREAQCTCFGNKIPCEKSCGCPTGCPHRFAGCSCASGKARKSGESVCFEDDRCACFQVGRECDPDLCSTCGSAEVVDPANRYNDSVLVGRCRHAAIQRGVPKRTLLGDSGVHGMGLYAGESIRRDEFIGEYKGETITTEEGDRRGTIYNIQNLSYLFILNTKQLIDSTYYGNKMRFINHRSVNANVNARIVMVNTVHRIALYSAKAIKPGEELFFDYGHAFPEDGLGGPKAKGDKSVTHLRNSKQIENFYEIEEVEDEAGNIRARKAAPDGKPRGRPKKGVTVPFSAGNANTAPSKRGGARPGSGRKPGKQVAGDRKQVVLSPRKGAAQTDVGEGVLGEQEEEEARESPQRRLEGYYISDERVGEEALAEGDESEDGDFEPEDVGEDE